MKKRDAESATFWEFFMFYEARFLGIYVSLFTWGDKCTYLQNLSFLTNMWNWWEKFFSGELSKFSDER